MGFTSGPDAVRAARATNEYMAELIERHPGRYGGFAVLPLPDVTAAVAEIQYAVGTLGLDGIGLFTHYNGTYLGEPEFDEVIDCIAELDTVAFVHPTIPPASDQPLFGLPPSLYEFPFETTRMLASLLYHGTLDRRPELKLIAPHAGGAAPYLAKRLTYAVTINPTLADREPADLLGSLRSIYFDTAMSANPHTLAGLDSFADTSHILFGTDYPFMPESTTVETVDGVNEFFTDDSIRRQVERDNALALFPALAERVGAGTEAAAAVDR
ncbi:amidohydrolase family protein [Nocardioides sp. LS1]|uniref:amidohydrolase family protein n=1 Tax=Nocardioides sp. LS1 TaxID=1027620 RepID=UPI001C8C76D9